MLTEQLKRRLSLLRRGQGAPAAARTAHPAHPAQARELGECFPEGAVEETARGEVFACSAPLTQLVPEASRLARLYAGAFERARELGAEALPRQLRPLAEAEVSQSALIDTETAGLHGRPLFLVGLVRPAGDELVLSQYFARTYAEEAALLGRLSEILPEIKLLISFNGKSFDWPFVRDRMVYHRLLCAADLAHLDLLHASRRRWRGQLPDCRLQTLERFICRRWRRGDIPGAEIPQRYHDFVREQDARLIAPIFHHNRLDLITMIEVLVALIAAETKGSTDDC